MQRDGWTDGQTDSLANEPKIRGRIKTSAFFSPYVHCTLPYLNNNKKQNAIKERAKERMHVTVD